MQLTKINKKDTDININESTHAEIIIIIIIKCERHDNVIV